MNIVDVRKLAWSRRVVVEFLSTIPIGAIKSTFDLADDFISHYGVDNNNCPNGIFYDILNNMSAGFDYLIHIGDASLHRDNEGMPFLTFNKHSGLTPRN